MNPEDLLTDTLHDRVERTDYPSTPLSTVAGRAGAIPTGASSPLASRPSLSSAATCLARSGWSGCCSAPWTSAVACATSPVSRPAWSRPRPAVHRDA